MAAAEDAYEAAFDKVTVFFEKTKKRGKCEELMHECLASIKVSREAHFGGTFTGNNCGRLIAKISSVLKSSASDSAKKAFYGR